MLTLIFLSTEKKKKTISFPPGSGHDTACSPERWQKPTKKIRGTKKNQTNCDVCVPEGVVSHKQLIHQGLLALLVGHAGREVLRGALLDGADLLAQNRHPKDRRPPKPSVRSAVYRKGGDYNEGGGIQGVVS